MVTYKVGQVIPLFVNHNEEVKFDIDDSGATMIVFFSKPTASEKMQFKSNSRFEMMFTELQDIIIITVKFGSLNWMDAPYTPHLSKNLTKFQLPGDGEGLALTVILVDANTGKIESIRLIGLSEDFSRRLIGAALDQKLKEFDKNNYFEKINTIYHRYTTDQIVKLSRNYCKIG